MDKKQLEAFCKEWLAAWTGNNPDKLLTYYHENALYADPAHRDGLQGHNEIKRYFVKLLDVYHDWIWRPIEIFPIEKGAIVKWECTIPTGPEVIQEIGLDIVEITNDKITRNEVYFDRTRLLAAVEKRRRDQRLINL
ncbi:MAG: nuclear transport factor 2 family protein [Candidatus Thorarchaeota archaeon]|nr:nuclear transport factor 2 family protein [Candidatus Thorarchaeota archaeon]